MTSKLDPVEKEELAAWTYAEDYFVNILNGDYLLEDAISDIKSFRNSKYYTGTNEKFKKVKD